MIPSAGRVRVAIKPPRDRMVGDRLRAALRAFRLGLRAAALLTLGVLRRRNLRPPPPSRVTRLLVIRTDRLGDMALTAESLLDLRAHFARAQITVLAPPGPLALLAAHPAVDRGVALKDGRLPPSMTGRFDLAVDFTPDESLLGARLAAASRAKFRAGMRAAGRQILFNLRGPKAVRERHVIDLNRDLLQALGITLPPRSPRMSLFVTPEERGQALSLLTRLGAAEPRVAIHPGAFYRSQRWSPERFAVLIGHLTEQTGAACVVLSGPGEEVLAQRICAATPDALNAGPQSVRGMMALLAVCDLFIGNNSGPLHIAGALGVPTVSLMGPTDPRRFAPRGPADRFVRRDLPCSPCGRGRCWHHTCLRAIEPDEVLVEALAVLREYLPRREAR